MSSNEPVRNECEVIKKYEIFHILNIRMSPLFCSLIACSIEFCGSLLWSPILPIQHPFLPSLHRKKCMVGISSGKFLH